MKKQMNMLQMVITIFALTIICIVLGIVFHKTEAEKVSGLSDVFDVGKEGMIAYISHDQGKPGLYVHTQGTERKALELSTEERINDIAFSPDGTTLAFVKQTEEAGSLYTMDVRSFDTIKVMEEDAIFTNIVYNPEEENELFYLKADVFENYSPIAQAHPHEFDLYRYDIQSENEDNLTNLSTYEMSGLQIAPNGESAYFTMIDDTKQGHSENYVSTGSRLYQMPLDKPEDMEQIELPMGDIYDIAVLPEEAGIIFQAVSNPNEGGTYQYNLYLYDGSSKETTQLTDLQTYASKPVLSDDGKTIYFIEDTQFAGQHANYRLHKINMDGTNDTPIPLKNE